MEFSISEFLGFTDEEVKEICTNGKIEIPPSARKAVSIIKPKIRELEHHKEQIIHVK